MLWYKAWLDTRWRFLIGLALLVSIALGNALSYPWAQAIFEAARHGSARLDCGDDRPPACFIMNLGRGPKTGANRTRTPYIAFVLSKTKATLQPTASQATISLDKSC